MLEQTTQTEGNSPGGIQTVTVYAASSDALDAVYFDAARRTGGVLAEAGFNVCFGGGGTGLMGAMADGALQGGAEVHGVVPVFLKELEVSHRGLTSLTVVDDMRTRKHLMLEESDAVITLPGGCGTYEEVFEAFTLKRLGQWLGPIVLVNTHGFYDRLISFLEHSVNEGFMGPRHAEMWQVVDHPEEIPEALRRAPAWSENAIDFANVTPQ
jgi:uncharacterized protein (TIGR00730 family)